jgi:hypothetical protein
MKIELRRISRGRQTLFYLFTASVRLAMEVKAKVVPHPGSRAAPARKPLKAGILRKKVRKSRNLTDSHGL